MKDIKHHFLSKGGKIGTTIQAKDWSTTSLGPIESWPHSLRQTLGLLLNSQLPMLLFWGSEQICFKNEAFIQHFENNANDSILLGQSLLEKKVSVWNFLSPALEKVLKTGDPYTLDQHKMATTPNEGTDHLYWNFNFSPIFSETETIAGVLLICTEAPQKTLAETQLDKKQLDETAIRYQQYVLQNPNPICIFRGPDFLVEIANQLMLDIWDCTEEEVLNKPILEVISEKDSIELQLILENVFSSGQKFISSERLVAITKNNQREQHYLNFIYEPLKETDGTITGVLVIANDVTLQIILRNAVEDVEKIFRNTLKQVPLGIAILKGADLIVELANPTYLQIIDKKESDLLGKPIFNVVPEAKDAVYPLLSEVYATGVPYYSDEFAVTLHRYEKQESCFFNLVFHPLRDENDTVTGVLIVAYEVTQSVKSRHLLFQSEEAFRKIVMESPIPMAIFRGKNHIIELANNAMIESMWQRPDTETIGKPLFELFPELLDQKYPELMQFAISEQKIINESEAIIYSEINGTLQKFYIDYQYTPLIDNDGETSGIMATLTDVTSQVEARKKVENAEERIRLATEIAGIATWDLNLRTREVFYSPRLLRIFGFKKNATVTHEQILTKIHPQDLLILEKAYENALKTSIYTYETRIIKDDESISWIKVHGKIYLDENKEPYKMLGTIIDITDEKNSRQILMKSEEKFRLLADSMPQHVWTSDERGNLNYFNKSVYTYSGIKKEVIAKNGRLQIVHPDERAENMEKWMQAINTGNDFLMEHRFRRYDGVYRWQLSRAKAQKDEFGNIQMWVGTSTDIQDQKDFASQLEREVQERTSELESKNKDLINMNIELQSFAYVSSHDLQEPLRKIQTFVSRLFDLEDTNISKRALTFLDKIDSSAKRMQTLIQDLLEYSRTNSNERVFVMANLDEIAQEVRVDFTERIEETNAVVIFQPIGQALVIPFQFRQLLYNLIGNALKFSKKETTPYIEIKNEQIKGETITPTVDYPDLMYNHISVSDNGIGFDSQYKSRIFDVFQRLNTEKEFSGTGIGLAIVKKIVENHKGVITATSELGVGTTFDIYLPILKK